MVQFQKEFLNNNYPGITEYVFKNQIKKFLNILQC